MQSNLALSELVEFWYERAKESGFRDIEQPFKPDSPLIVWDSVEFAKPAVPNRINKRSVYQARIDLFANSPEFPEIVQLMVRHGNNLFCTVRIEKIWDLHRDAISQRSIAREMGCSKTCIHYLLKRMNEWMSLTV